TRSSPSAHRSPLTRYPLGAPVIIAAIICAGLGLACVHRTDDYTLQVRGIVVDEEGKPVVDAHVVVQIPPDEPAGSVRHGEAWTDSRGGFGFDFPTSCPVQHCELSVEKQGFAPVRQDADDRGEIRIVLRPLT